jgi:DNA-binding MarR family transcriptional regulator
MSNFQVFGPLPQLRELSLLVELENTPIVSQRKLAIRSGMALGATNTCLRRMIERGWIQVRNENRHRTEYYLTKRGLSEKDRLTAEIMRRAVNHYVWMKDQIMVKLLEMQSAGVRRVAFYGTSDEVEIAYMTIQGMDLKLVGIIEDGETSYPKELFGVKLKPVDEIISLHPEGILVMSFSGIENRIRKLEKYIESSKIKFLYFPGVRD